MFKKTVPITGTAIALIVCGLCTLVHAAMTDPKAYVIAEITVTDPEVYTLPQSARSLPTSAANIGCVVVK